MKKFLVIAVLIVYGFLNVSAQIPYWQQMGQDINGEMPGDLCGNRVSISDNGLIVAIGSPHNDGNGSNSGQVRVFEWTGLNWIQKGFDIEGGNVDDYSASSLSFSNNGLILAIGEASFDGFGSDIGRVRIFEWGGASWVQKGPDLQGQYTYDNYGLSVSLNGDGTNIAIGCPNYQMDGSGLVKVFQWDGTTWIPKGSAIFPAIAPGDESGKVSLSDDGMVLAVGTIFGGFSGGGYVRLYHWNGSSWVGTGFFNAEGVGDAYGRTVSISGNGLNAAFGAPSNDGGGADAGHVRVFTWNGVNWVQKGGDIDGESPGDNSGISVSMNFDGSRLAIGATQNDGSGTNAGHARIYDWNGMAWVLTGSDIDGEAAGDVAGVSVGLNADGTTVVIGAHSNDGNGNNSGHARIYRLVIPPPCQTDVIINTTPFITAYTESNTWIETAGQVVVPMNNMVNFDADPAAYVKLNAGFKAEYGSVFVAEAFNGCSNGAPLLPMQKIPGVEEPLIEVNSGLKIYPNPTSGLITIEHDEQPHEIVLYDLKGTKLSSVFSEGKTISQFDLSPFSKGIYVIRVDGFKSVKVIKE